MHVRFTTMIGMPVTDDHAEEDIGGIGDILLNPDTGTVEGFFVLIPSFLELQKLFLSVSDIVHVGTRVRVRDADVLAPVEDVVRLQALMSDERSVLGQAMLTESGTFLGTCRDVQYETQTFRIEWFFPKRMFRWRPPVSAANILEIRPDAIIVRDPALTQQADNSAEAVLASLEPFAGTPLSRRKE